MSNVVRLRLVLRVPIDRTASTPGSVAEVVPYPLTRYAGAVDRLARLIRSMPTVEAQSDAMVRHVEREWNRLCNIGADERAIARALIDFADAVWSRVYGEAERGGVA